MSEADNSNSVLYEAEGAIARITLNRPEKRNALNELLIAGLKNALQQASHDAAVRVVVFSGAGRDFCSGADLASLHKIADGSVAENAVDARSLLDLFVLMRQVQIPVVAAVRGKALADPTVRANAAFAFGFCGDSLNVHQLIERFSPEENGAVRGRIAEAAGRCGRRAGADLLLRRSLSSKADSLGVLRGLFFATTTGSTDTSHVRFALSLYTANDAELDEAALQVAARSKAQLVKPFVKIRA